jgi:hypothetical protein
MLNQSTYEGTPFYRQIEVLVYPVSELVARQKNMNKNSAKRIFSDGTQDTLRVSFHVEQNILTIPGYAIIKIYNMTPETRLNLSTPGAWRLELNVGTDTLGMQELFSGAVIAGETEKQGPDVVTTLWCHSNYVERMVSFHTKAYASAYNIKDILKECAGIMQLKYDESRILIPELKIGLGGFAFAGNTRDLLTKLAFQYGFSWSVVNDCLQVLQDGKTFPRVHLISYKNDTLLSALPSLEGIMKIMYAVKVRAYLNPLIWAGDYIQLESTVNSSLNGGYLCHSISFDGSTFDDTWTMDINCKIQNPGTQDWTGF